MSDQAQASSRLPYIGLRPFDEADQQLYFGREGQVDALLTLLEDNSFLAIVGSSGCGKSSLVRAGLIPTVRQGFLLDCQRWQIAIAKPGSSPFQALATALADSCEGDVADLNPRLQFDLLNLLRTEDQALQQAHRLCGYATDTGLLVVIDQFEELFVYRRAGPSSSGASSRDEGAAFVRMLLRCANRRDAPLRVLITMRSDFVGDCEAYLGLPETISRSQFLVPRLDRSQMERALLGPSQLDQGGWQPFRFEDGLVTRIINDAGDRRDQLPLLQHALMQTWKSAHRRALEVGEVTALTLKDYLTAGGVSEALSRHADSALAELHEQKKYNLARRLFLLLCDQSPQGQLTRRRPTLAEVQATTGASTAEIRAVASVFQQDDRNFLLPAATAMIDDDVALEICHESLLRHWSQFNTWLGEEESDVAELRDWLKRTRRAGAQGGWLDETETELAARWSARVTQRGQPTRWALRYTDDGAFDEIVDYISRSKSHLAQLRDVERQRALREEALRVAAEQEKLTQARREAALAQAAVVAIRRRSRVAVGVGALALVFLLLALLAYLQARRALEAASNLAREAHAKELATLADSISKESPGLSILLALEARRIAHTATADALIRGARSAFGFDTVLRRHVAGVTTAQFSPNGKQVLTTSRDGTARLWDASTGKELVVLHGHEGSIAEAQFSADGKTVLTASDDATARLWHVTSGKAPILLRHKDAVTNVLFSPDGKLVLSVSRDLAVRLWEVTSGNLLRVMQGHTGRITKAQFSPDSKLVLTASEDYTARLWSVASGKQLRILGPDDGSRVNDAQFSPDGSRVNDAQFSPDGSTVVTASSGTVRVWDAASGTLRRGLTGHQAEVMGAQFSPDGKTVLTAGSDNTARLWDVESGKETHVLRGHESRITEARFSTDGRMVLTISDDQTVRLWDVQSRTELRVLRGHDAQIRSARFSSDGMTVLTASEDGTARLWNVAKDKKLRTLMVDREVRVIDAQFSADGKLITANADGTAQLWIADTGKSLGVLKGHTGSVVSAQFSADGRMAATTSMDKTVRLWDVTNGKELRVLRGHEKLVASAQFSADGKKVLTASWDQTARLWDVATGNVERVFSGHGGGVYRAEFSPDESMVLTASGDQTARVWEATSGKEIRVLRGHKGYVNKARFSANGDKVLSVGEDKTARLWEVASGKQLHRLRGHDDYVANAQFSPDGKTVLTASWDKTARIWDVASGKELRVLRGHAAPVIGAQFSADGKVALTVDESGAIGVWSCDECREIDQLAVEAAERVGRRLTREERVQYGLPGSLGAQAAAVGSPASVRR